MEQSEISSNPEDWRAPIRANRVPLDGWLDCSVRDGWKDIVLSTDEMLSHLDPEYKVLQIKEKFGTLRYYFTTEKTGVVNDIMNAVVLAAEVRSERTCEMCGKFGTLRDDRHWMQTLCDACHESYEA